jgi:hypothetical protein
MIPEVIAAMLFVGSTGLLFNERFRSNHFLVFCAASIALVSTYLLTEQIVRQIVSKVLVEWDRDPPARSSAVPASPASKTDGTSPHVPMSSQNQPEEFDLSVCESARTQWTSSEEGLEHAAPLRDFLGSVPARCLSLRGAIAVRIAKVEADDALRRETDAYQLALQTKTRSGYENFLRAFPGSQRTTDIRDRLSSCRLVSQRTGRAQSNRLEATAYMGGIDQSAAASARQECTYNLETECQRVGGVLSSARFQTYASFVYPCEAVCTVYESRQVDLCN